MKKASVLLLFTFNMFLAWAQCDSISIKIIAADTQVCKGDRVYLKAQIKGTSKPVTYTWSNNKIGAEVFYNADSTDLDIGVAARVKGCPDVYTNETTIRVINEKITLDYSFEEATGTFEFNVNAKNRTFTGYNIEYNNSACDTCHINLDLQSFILPLNGEYNLNFIHQVNDCYIYDTINLLVNINSNANYANGIPNAIVPFAKTPINEEFRPYSAYIESYEIMIFSKRGTKVFECNTNDCFWDGRDRKGNIVSSNVYYYVIYANDVYGNKQRFTGTVNVIY
ncbi:MAG: gliding motility-associated C-terminal domain-containing protein [Bacteroidia bacterium]